MMRHSSNSPYSRERERGLTLIEIVVAVAVFAVVVTAASATFVTLGRGTKKAEIVQNVNQTARAILEQISHEAKFAVGAKDPTTGRVWPPFLVRKAGAADTAFKEGENILIVTTTDTVENEKVVHFKAYGLTDSPKGMKLKLIKGKDNEFPPANFTRSTEDVTPPDVIVEKFKLNFLPDPLGQPSYNWINWNPGCDTNADLAVDEKDGEGEKPEVCAALKKTTSKRATAQPLLEILDFTLASTVSPANDPSARARITLRTAVSSRDYDLDQ